MIVRLGVGDTEVKEEGYLNVDIRDLPNVDVVADAADLPFKDAEHDQLWSRNLIEHFGRHEIDAVLKEWARVLKQGGICFIETVDAGLTMDNWRKIPTENWMDAILGAQTYPENFHKMAITKENITEKLYNAGLGVFKFENTVHREIPRMRVWAEKL